MNHQSGWRPKISTLTVEAQISTQKDRPKEMGTNKNCSKNMTSILQQRFNRHQFSFFQTNSSSIVVANSAFPFCRSVNDGLDTFKISFRTVSTLTDLTSSKYQLWRKKYRFWWQLTVTPLRFNQAPLHHIWMALGLPSSDDLRSKCGSVPIDSFNTSETSLVILRTFFSNPTE